MKPSKIRIFQTFVYDAKVFVIDDLNITKGITPSANKDLLKTIKDSMNSHNEEVVVFNADKNLNTPGKTLVECNKGVEIDTPVIEQAQLTKQIEKYEKSVHDLKELVGKVANKTEELKKRESEQHARDTQMRKEPDYNDILNKHRPKFRDTATLPRNDLFSNPDRNPFMNSNNLINTPLLQGMPKLDMLDRFRNRISNISMHEPPSGGYLPNDSPYGRSAADNLFNQPVPDNLFNQPSTDNLFKQPAADNLQPPSQRMPSIFSNNTPSGGRSSDNRPYGGSPIDTSYNPSSDGIPNPILNNSSPSNVTNVPKMDMLNSLQSNGPNSAMNEIINSFKRELSNYTRSEPFKPGQSSPSNYNNDPQNETARLNKDPTLNSDSSLFSGSPIEKQIEDKLAYAKMKEKNNLIKAIDNRKEYIKMKLQEIKANKEKLSIEMNSYKGKIANVLNQIKNIKKAKDALVNQINTNKNHILNLNKNSLQIIDRKEQVVSLIRITKNEVQRYRNLLENETNKLEMLEKQYEVYEDTLKKYGDDIDTESHKLNRSSTELNKSGIDLENLEDLYREYGQKNQQIEEELKRYENIVACLDAEEKKVMRNQLNGFVI